MTADDRATIVRKVVDFLREIGLSVSEGELGEDTFLPGIQIRAGALVYDDIRMKHPGDLLHEAAHLALATPAERREISATMVVDPGFEVGAIAWSYAASVRLGLDPAVVFHAEGYRGGARSLIDAFTSNGTPGVPILQWLELAARPDADPSQPRYPAMIRWLRE